MLLSQPLCLQYQFGIQSNTKVSVRWSIPVSWSTLEIFVWYADKNHTLFWRSFCYIFHSFVITSYMMWMFLLFNLLWLFYALWLFLQKHLIHKTTVSKNIFSSGLITYSHVLAFLLWAYCNYHNIVIPFVVTNAQLQKVIESKEAHTALLSWWYNEIIWP